MRPSRKRDEEEIHQVQSWGWNSWKNYSYEWKSSYYSNGWRKVRRYQESSVCNEASKETCGRCLRQEEQSDSSSKLHAAVAVQTRTWKLRKSRYQPNVRWIGSAKRRMRPSCYKLHDHFHATGRFLRNFSIRVIFAYMCMCIPWFCISLQLKHSGSSCWPFKGVHGACHSTKTPFDFLVGYSHLLQDV